MDHFFFFQNMCRHLDKEGRLVKASGSIEAGQVLTVKGQSGSGKSTLLRLLARIIRAEEGEAYLLGRSWNEMPFFEWRSRVHYVGQKPVVFPASVEENFKLPFKLNVRRNRRQFSLDQTIGYMKEAGLPASILGQDARTLSGGEAARLALVRALLIEPQVLLLDEPMAYLDGSNRQRVIRLLDKWKQQTGDRAIVIVSHQDEDLSDLGSGPLINLSSETGD